MIDLYPDQLQAKRALYDAMRRHRTNILKLPTGGGKTVLAASIIEDGLKRGKRITFVVDAISLVDQTVERFVENGITDIGVIQGNHPGANIHAPVQVASVDTLARRKIPHADLVIVDEAHCQRKFLYDWMGRWSAIPFVGLTATPFAKGMGEHWENLVVGGTIRELIDRGRLSDYRIFAASHPDLAGIRTVGGDYATGPLGEAMQRGALVGDTVRHWRTHAGGRPTLAFCVNRAHAKRVQQEFESHGIACGYIDGYTDRLDRQAIADQFHAGKLQVVASVGCLTKGVDWDVRCILMLRPTKSEMLWLQIVGRGLRTAEGKDDCLILDHSDTTLRLGFPEDVDARHADLDDGSRATRAQRDREEPMPKPCPSCSFIKPPKTHKCPACGFAPERQFEGEEVNAPLAELKRKEKLNRQVPAENKAQFYAGLLHIAKERGYKPGWASNKYRECLGVWPNAYKYVEPAPPSEKTLSWVKSRQIAFAKRRAA